jgi:HAE1 family hydrophobic/amphiphilic exporter-1
MKPIVRWSIRNSPAINSLLVATLLLGAASFVVMRREVFPNFQLEILLVTTIFPGATATEVEESVCEVLESAISGTDGVKKMNSVAREGFGYIILELNSSIKDVQPVLNNVKRQIDRVAAQLPPRAEKPEVEQIIFRVPAITLGIVGPGNTRDRDLQSELALRELAEEVRSELLELRPVKYTPIERLTNPRALLAELYQPKGAAITSADIVAERPFEISVEIDEDALRQYGLSLNGFARSIRQQNIDVPGGKMETVGQELLLRGNNKRSTGGEIAELPVLTKPNGDIVRIRDVAEVIDGFSDTVSIHSINGNPGIAIRVTKTDSEDLFTIVDSVKNYVARKQLPAGYELVVWRDISLDVQDRINLLMRNGIQGLILVFIALAIFLDFRLAFWVALGIPIAILGAGIALLLMGQTLNMLSMFAFLMALGIVVDDAIVIGENIFQKRQQGLGFVSAAIEGTAEVFPSVLASVATTIIAFAPLLFVTGVMGKFISVMPVAVITMLCLSLLESIFILPEHLAHEENMFMRMLSRVFYIFKPLLSVVATVNQAASNGLNWVIDRLYEPLLHWSLHHKVVVLSTMLAVKMFLVGLIASGIAPFSFFPKLDEQEISASIAFANGTSSDFAVQAIGDLRKAILEIDREIQDSGQPGVINNIFEKVGEVGDGLGGPTGVTSGSHVGTISVFLKPPTERTVTSQELNRRWRERVKKISGTEVLKFASPSMGPGGSAIELKVLAGIRDIPYLDSFVEECKQYLARQKGVFDIEDDARPGKWEMTLRLNEQGQALGLDEANLAETIRGVFYGEEVMRLQRGRHEVKLMVRYPAEARSSIDSLDSIRIRDNSGQERPLTEVAEIRFDRQQGEIKRMNQKRAVTVTADVDRELGNAREIIAEMQQNFLPQLLARFRQQHNANLMVDWEGEQAQTMESMTSMFVGFAVAVMAMFILLTFQFRSYGQPLIILSIIPFGWIGAILGHSLLKLDLTLFSFFGLIALTGVVVNDSIVLVDFINHRVRNGMPLYDALISAGKRRFRPIFLTSLTTICGLLPILFERSTQAQVIIPMAVSLAFGLLTGTLLILILVPVFYQCYGILMTFLGGRLYAADDDDRGNEQDPVHNPPDAPAGGSGLGLKGTSEGPRTGFGQSQAGPLTGQIFEFESSGGRDSNRPDRSPAERPVTVPLDEPQPAVVE